MTSTTTPAGTTALFDMSKMEQRTNTSSLLDDDLDDSSWGELCVDSVVQKEDQATISTRGTSTRRSVSALDHSALSGLDGSSWGELDLDERIDDDDAELQMPSFRRRHTTDGAPRCSRTKTTTAQDISFCASLVTMEGRRTLRQEQDDDDKVDELAHCLTSLYGDYRDDSSSNKKKTNKRFQNYTKLPALTRFTTA